VVGDQIYPLDSLKETVRLGAGLTAEKQLDDDVQERALAALQALLRAPRGMPKVGARRRHQRAARGQELGAVPAQGRSGARFPIEVIPGREEARLIYLGVVHSLPLVRAQPPRGGHRRRVDRVHHRAEAEARAMESLYMGCVSYTRASSRRADRQEVDEARELAAREQVQTIAARFEKRAGRRRWAPRAPRARSPRSCRRTAGRAGITAAGLEWLREELLAAGD
jgi:exopolyphosphatase/guanosine-5'-triphosphate,3'-diphosphate pyrophosphatase